jgi:hypothetical protein
VDEMVRVDEKSQQRTDVGGNRTAERRGKGRTIMCETILKPASLPMWKLSHVA